MSFPVCRQDLRAAIEWLAAFPRLSKQHKRLVARHNSLVVDQPELLVQNFTRTFPDTVEESVQHHRVLQRLLTAGRQECRPFEVRRPML